MIGDIWISLVIVVLVDYRISRMIGVEEGPFEVFTNLRSWFYNHNSPGWIQRGIICPLCISFWVSIPLALLMVYQLHLDWYAFFYLWLALSGAVSFLYKAEK